MPAEPDAEDGRAADRLGPEAADPPAGPGFEGVDALIARLSRTPADGPGTAAEGAQVDGAPPGAEAERRPAVAIPAPAADPPSGSPEPDSIVVRLAEIAGDRLDAPEVERRQASLRHLRHAALADMGQAAGPGADGAAVAENAPVRETLPGAAVRPRRPAGRRPSAKPVERAPGEEGGGVDTPAGPATPPLVLSPSMRVRGDVDRAAEPRGTVRPRRIAPRGA